MDKSILALLDEDEIQVLSGSGASWERWATGQVEDENEVETRFEKPSDASPWPVGPEWESAWAWWCDTAADALLFLAATRAKGNKAVLLWDLYKADEGDGHVVVTTQQFESKHERTLHATLEKYGIARDRVTQKLRDNPSRIEYRIGAAFLYGLYPPGGGGWVYVVGLDDETPAHVPELDEAVREFARAAGVIRDDHGPDVSRVFEALASHGIPRDEVVLNDDGYLVGNTVLRWTSTEWHVVTAQGFAPYPQLDVAAGVLARIVKEEN